MNNAFSQAIDMAPNELLIGMRTNDSLKLLPGLSTSSVPSLGDVPRTNDVKDNPVTDVRSAVQFLRTLRRNEAAAVMAFAKAKAKYYFDKKHKNFELNVGDRAFLRLHKGYRLPAEANPKLSNQYAGPFLVLRRQGRLAYELDIPNRWKIHPVVSVAQLEPAPKGPDPYDRPKLGFPEVAEDVPGDSVEWKSYELDKIVNKRMVRIGGGRKLSVEYLVRFKNAGPQFDEPPLDLATNPNQNYKGTYQGIVHRVAARPFIRDALGSQISRFERCQDRETVSLLGFF